MLSKTLSVLVLVSSTLATVFVTAPTSSTVYHGGQPAQINWQDDGSAPSLKDFGPAKISIYVGNAQQQTLLQSITGNQDVSTTSTLSFTPNPQIGPNDNNYFIRFESLSCTDPKNPLIPCLAFSAKFTLDNMSGTYTDAIKAQIAGQSTAPLGGQPAPTPAASSPASGAPAVPSGAPAVSSGTPSRAPTSSAARSSTAAAAARSSGAALSTQAGWAGVILSALIGATAF